MSEIAKKLTEEYGSQIIENRRYLHAHPELSLHETETSAWIKKHLEDAGISILDGITGNSVVGYLEGETEGPSIGFRADFDALGMEEDNDLPFKSQNPGAMHACGHDAHTATLMAFAETMAKHKDLIKGKLYFVFQMAEEFQPGGAVQLCNDGVMKYIDYIFTWHVAADLPYGIVDLGRGARYSAVGTFDIYIDGIGGHSSAPHKANNPILVGMEIATAIQNITPMKLDPFDTCTISICNFISGVEGVANVIPAKCVLGGTVRSFDTEVRDRCVTEIGRLAEKISEVHDCKCECKLVYGYPAVVNDDACYEVMKEAIEEMGLETPEVPANFGAEDFAYYGLEKPAGILRLGMADHTGKIPPTPHHSPIFFIDDEPGLPMALEMLLTIYEKALDRFAK